MPDILNESSASLGDLPREVERLRLLHAISLEFSGSLDFDELLPRVFHRVLAALGAEEGSIWIAEGDLLRCRLAVGGRAERLIGAEMPVGTGFVGDVAQQQKTTIVTRAQEDPRFQPDLDRSEEALATNVMATAMVTEGVTVGAIQISSKVSGDGMFDGSDRELLEGVAALAAVSLRNARLHGAERRADELAVLLDISREITATLDLDRVLQSVVHLAARALPFDRGAVGLYEKGHCDIRAVSGEEKIDPKDPRLQDLVGRAEWAAGRGSRSFSATVPPPAPTPNGCSSRSSAPISKRTTSGAGSTSRSRTTRVSSAFSFSNRARPTSPRRPSAKSRRSSPTRRRWPFATRSSITRCRWWTRSARWPHDGRRWRRCRGGGSRSTAAVALAIVAALTLIRWPLRVPGTGATFRPTSFASVRALVPGVVERIPVTEGLAVARGTPIAYLRANALRADRETTAAEASSADRLASLAASRGDAADERLQRARGDALRRELALIEEELGYTVVRAPVSGIVLTPRPEERTGTSLEEGDLVLTIGRTDTLELEFGVSEQDIGRVRPGEEVRLRVDALPQHTFTGRVVSVAPFATDSAAVSGYPVRALVANPDGLLKPRMTAYVRVLTDPESAATRLIRGPARWARLLWWRMWS